MKDDVKIAHTYRERETINNKRTKGHHLLKASLYAHLKMYAKFQRGVYQYVYGEYIASALIYATKKTM